MVQTQRRVESFFSEKPYKKQQAFVSLDQIPLTLQRAVIAAEDGRFYDHAGIDWQELGKVLDEREHRGRLRGGSTITQQLVKNLFLTTHSNPLRKGLETPIVPLAEILLSKQRILELYLNVIEWGPGVYGVEAAARYHYGVPAAKLSREQAARLAACIPSPLRRRPQRMDSYSSVILTRMASRGW
jgi:monofunctional biosynthetic peptidoglycan transglycosylase